MSIVSFIVVISPPPPIPSVSSAALIARNVRSIPGGDPAYLRTQGKLLAMKALDRYDPTKASMATYLTQQLMPLRRTSRQQMNLTGIPDRLMIANQRLESAQTELLDELGREPTLQEVADRINVSVKQLRRMQNMGHAKNTGSYAAAAAESMGEGGPSSPEVRRRLNDEYVNQYVLSDLDPVSAEIFKHDNQLGGKRRLSTEALARKLGLSPGAISQRRNKIALHLQRSHLQSSQRVRRCVSVTAI